jgi:hypothetical protein
MKLLKDTYQNLTDLSILRDLYIDKVWKKNIKEEVYPGNSNEELFAQLLFYGGYITQETQQTYRIPNKEVYMCLFGSLLSIWIEKTFKVTDPAIKITTEMSLHVEDITMTKNNIEKYLLSGLNTINKSEHDFQFRVAAPFLYAEILGIARHTVHVENQTIDKKTIDIFLRAIEGLSSTSIIIEEKLTIHANKVEKKLLEAIWQIYSNGYLNRAFNDPNDLKPNVELIIARVEVYYLSLDGKWCVEIQEFIHTYEGAKAIANLFFDKIENDHEQKSLLKNLKARSTFLKKIRPKYSNIYKLINEYVATAEELKKIRKQEEVISKLKSFKITKRKPSPENAPKYKFQRN